MQDFRKWCYNALPVIGFLTFWWGCAKLTQTYLNNIYIGGFIGFWLGGWVLTYKEDEDKKD